MGENLVKIVGYWCVLVYFDVILSPFVTFLLLLNLHFLTLFCYFIVTLHNFLSLFITFLFLLNWHILSLFVPFHHFSSLSSFFFSLFPPN